MSSRKQRELEELKRRRQVRRRFKILVRIVMYNRTWLLDMEEQKLSLNVNRNIAMLIRPHRKSGILTLPEKSLLRTQHDLRSVKDRKRLVSLFASLACFSSFSPRVRARLVPVTTFADLQKNRFIIREGAEPLMIYFILYGEVEVYRKTFNHMTQNFEEKLQGLLGTGDCVGEMEFIEGLSKRQNTYSTSMDTEVLVMLGDDFERILQPAMSQQWMERKTAIRAMQYFDFFNNAQIMFACKLGLIRQFDPLETIYYEDKGLASYVYFVISGECMILQCLKVKTKTKKGSKTLELVDVSEDKASDMFEELTNKEIMRILLEESRQNKIIFESDIGSGSNEDEKALGTSTKPLRAAFVDIETLCSRRKNEKKSDSVNLIEEKSSGYGAEIEFLKIKSCEEASFEKCSDLFVESNDSEVLNMNHKLDSINHDSPKSDIKERVDGGVESSIEKTSRRTHEDEKTPLSANRIPLSNSSNTSSSRNGIASDALVSPKQGRPLSKSTSLESEQPAVNHFIDVGAMTFGGIFGLGEKMEHRVVMARTRVQCLLIPRFWLLEKEQNPGNVWQRRRFYLDCTIPSRQALFNNFLATLKWQKFKKKIIESSVSAISKTNSTKVEDIPIICRVTEGSDDD